MVGLLSLEDSHHTCRREAPAQGAKKGRLDLVVRRQANGKAVAVLEMKGASDLHGDQLDRYNSWAKRINPAPKQFYCTLEGDGAAPPAPWQPLSLVQLFGAPNRQRRSALSSAPSFSSTTKDCALPPSSAWMSGNLPATTLQT
jgi:hypothetical protein